MITGEGIFLYEDSIPIGYFVPFTHKISQSGFDPSSQAKPFACSTDKTSLRSLCVGGRDRTSDPRLMSPVLYRLSYADDK
jgi:hypothetical protein